MRYSPLHIHIWVRDENSAHFGMVTLLLHSRRTSRWIENMDDVLSDFLLALGERLGLPDGRRFIFCSRKYLALVPDRRHVSSQEDVNDAVEYMYCMLHGTPP